MVTNRGFVENVYLYKAKVLDPLPPSLHNKDRKFSPNLTAFQNTLYIQSFFQMWPQECAPNMHINTETDNTALYTISQLVCTKYAKSSCAPPDQYKSTLCTTKVYVGTELHCQP